MGCPGAKMAGSVCHLIAGYGGDEASHSTSAVSGRL